MNPCTNSDLFFWEDWVRTTTKLKNSGYSLNIPIGKSESDNSLVDEQKAIANRMRQRIRAHYIGKKLAVHLFAKDLDTSYNTLRRRISGFDQWNENLKQKACELLGISTEEEYLYFHDATFFKDYE